MENDFQSDVTETGIESNVEPNTDTNPDTETNQVAPDNVDDNNESNQDDNDVDNDDLSFTDTQKYSKRLNRDREKIRQELEDELENRVLERFEEVARQHGFESWEEYQEQLQASQLDDLGVTDVDAFKKMMDDAVKNSDVVKEAEKIVKKHKEERQKELIADEIKEINILDPEINDVTDFAKMENYEEFEKLVKTGYSLVDAYKVVNFDKIAENIHSKKAKAEDIKKNSTAHQVEGKSSGVEGEKIDSEQLNIFRSFYPNLSDAEILKKYLEMKG